MINPNICFAFNKMHENCYFILDQNYNCVLGLKNITIQSFLFIVKNDCFSVALRIPDECLMNVEKS